MYLTKTGPSTDSSVMYLNKTGLSIGYNRTTTVTDIGMSTIGWYVNHTTQVTPGSELYETTSAFYVNETMTGFYVNETTQDWYFNDTNSTYNVATVSSPITGLTYTLFCITCCLTLFGLVGNTLILVSMFRFNSSSKGHGKLIISLAICDIITLVSLALEQRCVHDVLGLDFRAISTVGCKIAWAILWPAGGSSSGVVVLICVERFLAVWFPLQSRRVLTDKNILSAVLVCVTFFVLMYVTMSVLYVEIRDGVCNPNLDGTQYSTVLQELPNTTFYSMSNGFIITFFVVVLSVLTLLTIIKLYKQRNIRRQLTTSGPNSQLNVTEFRTSVKLISVVIAQVTLTGIPGIVTAIFGFMGITFEENTISAILLVLLLNYSINFVLYNVFDSEFRRNIFALLGLEKKKRTTEILMGKLNVESAGVASVGN